MLRRAIKTGDEHDAYTRWRKFYIYLSRPGVVKGIKRSTHRRERAEGRQDAQEQYMEYLDTPARCEDCGQCEGWACRGDSQYVPLPPERLLDN